MAQGGDRAQDAGGSTAIPRAVLLADGTSSGSPTFDHVAELIRRDDHFWLDVEAPDDDTMRRLADVFDLGAEALEDSRQFHQRTRMSEYGPYVLVVAYGVAEGGRTMLEVHAYLTDHHVLTVRPGPCPPIEALHRHPDRITRGSDTVPALLSRILTTLFATYSDALDEVDEELTDLETAIIDGPPSTDQLQTLLALKRRVNRMRRAADPAREIVGVGRFVVVDALPAVSDEARRYLRDLAVDLAHVGDQLEGERDRLSAVMDVYMSEVNNRQNVIMQQLTAVSTVFLPLMFITGFFGMNFAAMIRGVNSWPAFLALGIGLNALGVVASMSIMKRRGWW